MHIVSRYLLAASILLLAAGMFGAGAYWHERVYVAPYPENWSAVAPDSAKQPPDFNGRFYPFQSPSRRAGDGPSDTEKLNALGYLSGYVEAPPKVGVTLHDSKKAYGTLNLYTSGHAPEAYLMNMEGESIHRWRYSFEQLWPDEDATPNYTQYLRRVHLFENGDLLSIFEPHGIFKLDRDSKLLWSNHNGAHHDLAVHDDGTISLLTQKAHPVLWFSTYGTVIEDFVTQLTPDGELIREVSLLECFRDSKYSSYLELTQPAGDVTHANSLKLLDGRHEHLSPAFRRGNFLISVRELDVIVVLDFDAKEIVWALSGMWFRQHEATLLDNGHLLLFDNRGSEGKSKVVELDPITQEVIWTYGGTHDEPLFSETCGSVARLPNGNTLITESNNGRAFEVTPGKEIVWEYVSPHRAGANNELIATVLDMHRLPPTFTPSWLAADAAVSAAPF